MSAGTMWKGFRSATPPTSAPLRRMAESSRRHARRLLKSGTGSDSSTSLPRLKSAPRGARRMSSAL